MTTQPRFIDDVRTLVFFNDLGAPSRAVLELPTGTVEFGLIDLTEYPWGRAGLTLQHRVVHIDERPPSEPAVQHAGTATQSSFPAQWWWLGALVVAAFVAAACSGALIAASAAVLSRF